MHLLLRELSKAQYGTTVCSDIASRVLIGCGVLVFLRNILFLHP